MKFIKLTTNYPQYTQDFYSRHVGLEKAPFAQQRAMLEADAFGGNGGWGPALEALGHEYVEIVANVRPLQKSWAVEYGAPWSEVSWKTSVPCFQAEAFKPEIVFMDAPRDFDVAWLKHLRERCPSIRLILGWSQSPCDEFDVLRYYDALLSGSHFMLDHYSKKGCRTAFLRLGFNRKVLTQLPPPAIEEDPSITFSGGVARGKDRHGERERLLEAIVQSSVPLRLYSAPPGVTPIRDALSTTARRGAYGAMQMLAAIGVSPRTRRRLPVIGKAATWTSMPLSQISKSLWPHMRPSVYGLEMYKVLRQSAVSLNTHIDCTGPDAANLRLYEATGVGSCLLTDSKSNLCELFELDKEVVAYRSADECIEKGKWLLEHPQERRAIAAAGQSRTLRDHTMENRAVELDAIVTRLLAATSASLAY